MPTLSLFFGITVQIFFKDIERHHIPHIHARYGDFKAVIAPENLYDD
jgi:hypothetical protein